MTTPAGARGHDPFDSTPGGQTIGRGRHSSAIIDIKKKKKGVHSPFDHGHRQAFHQKMRCRSFRRRGPGSSLVSTSAGFTSPAICPMRTKPAATASRQR
jgi:hypothetical protein